MSHRPDEIAFGLDDTFQDLASRLVKLTGDHTRKRYLDSCRQDKIPAEMYTKEEAGECCRIAEELVQEVSKVVN